VSILVDLKTPHKKEMAEILRAIASIIEVSKNKIVTVNATVIFNPCNEAEV